MPGRFNRLFLLLLITGILGWLGRRPVSNARQPDRLIRIFRCGSTCGGTATSCGSRPLAALSGTPASNTG